MLRCTGKRLNEHLRLLGIEGQYASAGELKRAFREQAKIHHPDVGGDPEHFKRVCNSYSVLSGKSFEQEVASGLYTKEQSSPTWEYYYGTARTRADKSGSEHGRHGANWANHQGPDANYSTRDFYRPYESSRGRSGFTDAEIREAMIANRLHRAWRLTRNVGLAFGLACCYASYRNERIDSNERARQQGYDDAYWKLREEDHAKGLDTPLLSSYYERKKREFVDAQAEDIKRRKALGIRNPFDQSAVSSGPRALTFRGQPFTPEGLAASRKNKRIPPPPKDSFTDISYEIEDVEG